MPEHEPKKPVNDLIINRAVRIALRAKSKQPLEVGNVVAHPSDEYAYKLMGIEGSIAHVGYIDRSTGELVSKAYHFEEIFDLNLAMSIAVRLIHKSIEGAISRRLN